MGTRVNGVDLDAGTSGPDLSDAAPQPLGVAAAGVSADASRADHVHALPTIPSLSSATPQPVGTATAGVSADAARADHVHAPASPYPSTTGGVLILDPDDSSRVTLSSGRITAMASQVGALTVAQSTAGQRPLLVPRGLGGRAIVSCSASRIDRLTITNAALEIADPILLAVARVTAYAGHSTLFSVEDAAPTYARWGAWASSATTSDLRIDTDTVPGTAVQRAGETWERWAVYAYRVATREWWGDGRLIYDGPNRTPTYPAGPYASFIGSMGGEWAWLGIYDGATALSGTTWGEWALSQTAQLAARFGLQVRPT